MEKCLIKYKYKIGNNISRNINILFNNNNSKIVFPDVNYDLSFLNELNIDIDIVHIGKDSIYFILDVLRIKRRLNLNRIMYN